jgi:glucokinase
MSARGPWLGIDIGGTKVLVVCVDDDLRLRDEVRLPSGRGTDAAALLARCAAAASDLQAKHGARGLGVGFAGLVDSERGTTRSSIMLDGFDAVPVAAHLAEATGLPTRLDNDANTAALAELAGLGEPAGLHMVLLTVGTGIGGAIAIDGKLYRGAGGLAGELGNTTLDWQGQTCWCGNRGCANMLASGSALAQHATALGLPVHAGGATIVQRAQEGDPRAQEAVHHTARALGALVANVINIFNPHRVAIAGGLSTVDSFLDAVRAEVERRAFQEALAQATITRAIFGERSSAVGAAVLARNAARPTEAD